MQTRREFLRTATALASFPIMLSGAEPNREKYRGCLIGHTGRGNYGHSLDQSFQGLAQVEVVALADPNETGRNDTAKRLGIPRGYADYGEMLQKERPNLVAICTNYPEHRLEMIRAAAEAGAHIYSEKPIATTLEEADQMVAAVEKHNVRTAAAHHMRLVPVVLHLKKLLSEGLLGDLLEMRCRGKEDSRAGGEDLMILGWHCCYLMRFFAGEPIWCSGRVLQGGKEITREDKREATIPLGPIAGDSIHASYAFAGGVQGHFSSQRQHGTKGSDFQVVLYGSKGVAQIHIGAEPRIYYLPDPLWSPGKSGASWQPLPGTPPSVNAAGLSAEATNNTRLVADLLRAIQTGGQSVASLYEGRAVLEMILAVYESHLTGARTSFPLRKRTHPLLSV